MINNYLYYLKLSFILNRRTSIKSILAFSFIGVSSFSIYKWANVHQNFDVAKFLAHKELIIELAETIIPETDTPGAKKAGVENYIINVIVNCKTKLEQNKFLNGLRDVEKYALNVFEKSFVKCSIDEKNSILTYFSDKDVYSTEILNKINKRVFGETFFLQLKHLTIEGYCQSEIGATYGLSYDYIPVYYEPCIIMKSNQKSWATK